MLTLGAAIDLLPAWPLIDGITGIKPFGTVVDLLPHCEALSFAALLKTEFFPPLHRLQHIQIANSRCIDDLKAISSPAHIANVPRTDPATLPISRLTA
jgi:hypothetical protein